MKHLKTIWQGTVLMIFLCIWEITPLHAQISESQARALLEQKGIPEDTLRARLLQKGYDPDTISPEQLPQFQRIIIETVNEIEAERNVRKRPEDRVPIPNTTVTQPPATPEEQKPKQPAQSPAPPIDPKKEIYGQALFRNNSIAVYQKTENLEVPDSYVLDVGDQIGVIGFGTSQFDEILVVSQDGFVRSNERLPKILIKGLQWKDAKEVLYKRYSQYHAITRGQFQATLIKSRNMTIHMFGEAKTTGAITLPGVNTAINVISAAGGPTDIGSLRNIKVVRGNLSIPVDIYAFMNNPASADNYYLQNNDYIHIPVADKIVSIVGAVTRPMKYELLDHENLVKLIEYAGGAKPEAYLTDVQVTRYFNDRRIVANINLRELMGQGGDYVLLHGDEVELKSVEKSTSNQVTISGAVHFQGDYENKPGMRISDLITQAVLRPEARLDFANLLRYQTDGTYSYERVNLQSILANPASPDNKVLENQDIVQITSLRTFAETPFFSVQGAVKNPDTFLIASGGNLRVEDAILLSGGLEAEAADFGYIIRQNPREPKTLEYIDLNIQEAIIDPASEANQPIQSGDVLVVFDKRNQRDNLFVSIVGSVRNAGRYTFGPGMTLGDLINLAGGFTLEADHNRIDIARVDFDPSKNMRVSQSTTSLPDKDYQDGGSGVALSAFDYVYVRSLPEFELQRTVTINGEVKYPGAYALLRDRERISDLIKRSGGLTAKAFPDGAKLYRAMDSIGLVVINLEEILRNENTPSNVVLLEGDLIQIPKSKDLVTIEGFVNLDEIYTERFLDGHHAISVAFRGEKSARYYIEKFAAGVNDQGDPASIRVQYADGQVQGTRKFLFFNQYPRVKRGSHIIVGQKEEKPIEQKQREKTDWASVLRDTMAQATAVLTLLILVDQLSK